MNEYIVRQAVKCKLSGEVFTGPTHAFAYGLANYNNCLNVELGFVTSLGNWIPFEDEQKFGWRRDLS